MKPWPVLEAAPGRSVLVGAGPVFDTALEFTGALSGPLPAGRDLEQLLTDSEADLARGRTIDPQPFLWQPASHAAQQFLEICHAEALRAGGLYVYDRQGLAIECLHTGGDWAASFPLVRMQARDASVARPVGSPSGPATTQETNVLVFYNPAGEPALPEARREAERLVNCFSEKQINVHYVARTLLDHEWYELYLAHQVVFYFGHGHNVSGHPAIETRDGLAPFFAPIETGGESDGLLVFAACLQGGATLRFRNQGGAILYPICRLADRPSGYVLDFAQALLEGETIPTARWRAARQDAAAGDLRRYVFRLQGHGPAALFASSAM